MAENGSAIVAHNLENADKAQGLQPNAHVGAATTAGEHNIHAEPTVLGWDATGWVAVAMTVLILILIVKRVPAVIGAALDKQIAGIRASLDDAARLRADAEALKAEYAKKAADAAREADEIVAHAREEAAGIVAQAEADAADLIARRGRMAEDKIAAAERAAVAEVRAKAADAAGKAAALLIAERHGADADRALIDRTISGIGPRLN
ncbi:F0F1 ATP synthase subunit B [Sphingomonas jatrophae]|uniref:ATP synthase subunit b n=1 Tax=Sphingomonas jatrophae TaxID=1166337 RepID=A0A1I6JK58_9SPHN|nr:F0F1 ATP synthase subunit B [Sphingomonas jatrophae]SFR79345.1 F-type H+-transporting ATPase subunit b [Sphingomonas jatrophae]